MFEHITVLKNEAIDLLNVNPQGSYIDCTFGGGGHTSYLLNALDKEGRVIAFDQDLLALMNGFDRFSEEIDAERLRLIHRNFRELGPCLDELNISTVDGIVFDLGVSSPQLDIPERGFSYRFDAPLDMRMDQRQSLTAREIVNEWPYEELVRIFYRYGEERFSKQIAREIEKRRGKKPIESTLELVDIIKTAIPAPARRKGGHPAKRIFQAIRIAVNDELSAVEEAVTEGLKRLKVGGRMSVITFHSLEDGLVKSIFKEASSIKDDMPKNLPILPTEQRTASYRLVTKKPILPSQEEMAGNSRSESAKLRVIERVKWDG
ncbi:16S rRNA (cytosine(1402)-N(4))-methyltransferase RsmH [Atopobacter sp. AH10]|uniref:16S rRNA (cytosine(1402)-N(4))-methyltransferase RsmH n=1 Tax=Atopobacter sp. AH10 TaxID=2315861 RepID=UPI000EF1AF9B|nr:16S rRNA (cytosine(1402)-N(4))-methyltransferase RsmH [Atopobacter sp. AH10]RLK62939.1 16S rRNA (cytosine(1402)-N(4))-methyltransferase RsmH [Atopobacter sp. AH10]